MQLKYLKNVSFHVCQVEIFLTVEPFLNPQSSGMWSLLTSIMAHSLKHSEHRSCAVIWMDIEFRICSHFLMCLHPFDGDLDDRSHFHFNENRWKNLEPAQTLCPELKLMPFLSGWCSFAAALSTICRRLRSKAETDPERRGLHASTFRSSPSALRVNMLTLPTAFSSRGTGFYCNLIC